MNKKIRKIVVAIMVSFIVMVSLFLIYYAQCYYKNDILIFDKDDHTILLGFLIMNFVIMTTCVFAAFGSELGMLMVKKLFNSKDKSGIDTKDKL